VKTDRRLLSLGFLCGGLSVALGAFAAHGLRDTLSTRHLEVFQTGVQYQFFHSLLLIGLGIAVEQIRKARLAGAFVIAGIVLFSGSLYALAISGISMLGAITPFGGVSFLMAWSILFIFNCKSKKD
jgi:uncharacterized membrane protein YgdD (TMEM256/DUF423 family)